MLAGVEKDDTTHRLYLGPRHFLALNLLAGSCLGQYELDNMVRPLEIYYTEKLQNR